VIDDRVDHFIGAVQQEEPKATNFGMRLAGITRMAGGSSLRLDDDGNPLLIAVRLDRRDLASVADGALLRTAIRRSRRPSDPASTSRTTPSGGSGSR
jgi:hypothetical protein